ncbi:zinc finger, CCHC-type containing protein [Tanacetum coccineum]
MAAAAMKYMALNFVKLDKFEGVDFQRWQKKMHFLLSSMSVVYVLTTPMLEDGGDNPTMEQVRKRAKWDNDDYVCRGLIINVMEQYNELLGILGRFTQHKMNMDEAIQVSCIIDKLPPSWKYFKHTLKYLKEELTLVELGSHLHIEESLWVQDNDKPKGNNVAGPSVVNMAEHKNSSKYNENKGKRKHHGNTKADPNKKPKVTCWKCGKPGHLKKNCEGGKVSNKENGSGKKGSIDGSSNSLKAYFVQDDDVAWWVDSGATVHMCKHRCWFKTHESLNDGSILHMRNKSTALVHRRGYVDLKFSSGNIVSLFNVLHVPNINKNLVSSSVLNNCGYKQVIESNKFVLSKHGVFIGFGYLSNHMFRLNIVNDNIGSAFMSTSKLNDSILWHVRLGHVHFKRMQDMFKDGLIPAFDMWLTQGFWGEAMLTACYLLYRVPKKRNRITSYELWTKRKPKLNYLRVWGCREIDDPKTFDEAIKSQDVDFWKEAINDEMDSIMGNNTWVLADLPPGCKPLGCKWIFKIKWKVDGTVEKFKARSRLRRIIIVRSLLNLLSETSTKIIMANLPPNHNEFALAAEVAPNNMNGWIEEEEDPEIEEEEDPEEDPEMEEEEEEMDVDADEEWDGLEWMLPY